MNLLLVHPEEVQPDGRVVFCDRRAFHVRSVLGARVGDMLRAGVVRGATGQAEVLSVDESAVECRMSLTDEPLVPHLELVLAMPRPKVLSRCLALAACMGTQRVHLINSWRVDKAYFQSPRLDAASTEAAFLEGCEQGGGTWVPTLTIHRRFMGFVEDALCGLPSTRVVAHPRAEGRLTDTFRSGAAAFAVGPEGGWIGRELETLQQGGFVACDLGMPTLRVEPAIAAIYAQWALAAQLR